MSTEPDAIPTPRVRSLARWGIPFHYAVPVAVGLVGVLLLAAGGGAGFVGGWWLVVALPIAIGAFLQDPWFAAGPVAVWIGWLIVAAIAGGDSDVSHTPFGLAIALAVVGAVATRVAQFAIFPATARAAWEPTIHRLAGTGDDDAEASDEGDDADDGEPHLPELDMTQMTVTIDAIDPIGTAEHAELSEAADSEALRAAAKAAEIAAQAEVEPTVDASAPAVAEADAVDEEPEPAPKPTPEPAPEPKVVHTELPLDADPAPLDEGGHVTEFKAITEADVLAAEDDEPAPAPSGQPGSDVP